MVTSGLKIVNLTQNGRLETAATQTKPTFPAERYANVGFKTLDFPLVRTRRLRLYSREFYSPGLKLTQVSSAVPLRQMWSIYLKIAVNSGDRL
jgi:hypothetical protein